MADPYSEYLELYEYFGREVALCLEPDEFEQLAAELATFVARRGELSAEELRRALAIRDLLLRDRPRTAELTTRAGRPKRW